MGWVDGVTEARRQLTGSGINEAPPLATGSLGATVDKKATFTLAADSPVTGLQPGYIICLHEPESVTEAYTLYVLSVDTNDRRSGVCKVAYNGSPTPPEGGVEETFWELNPPDGWTPYVLFLTVQTILEYHLWPHVWKWSEGTIPNPDPTVYQSPVPSTIRQVDKAWQYDQLRNIFPVKVRYERNVPTGLSDTGALLYYGQLALPHYPLFYRTREEFTAADLGKDIGVTRLVGTGAAALSLDAGVVARSLMPESSTDRTPPDKARLLWRAFVTQRESFSDDLRRDVERRLNMV